MYRKGSGPYAIPQVSPSLQDSPGSVQGQVRQDLEQPVLLEGVPVHARGVEVDGL